ncbi:MAG: SDR family NAD(P)-dependent oxidoreductase [Marinibacterium sp.]|nr:SDR family NAD(P)-dependent oxidoreductase [Marinibacterium sp.]
MTKGYYSDAVARGGVAVVTGAASGVGLAAAQRFAASGLGVLLADLPGDALMAAADSVRALAPASAVVEPVPCDVAQDADVSALADRAFDLGEVAVLMNNAGVARPTTAWGEPDNWRMMTEVNLFGVLRGMHAFLPRMVAAARPAVVINTGSKQGITTPPGNPGYNMTKAGIKAMTEQVAHDLRRAEVPISAHLFVPGFTYTGMIARAMPQKPDAAWTSDQTVEYFITRMGQGDFYILCPDNDVSQARDRKRVTWAAQDITENRPALSRWHPDYEDAFKAFESDV